MKLFKQFTFVSNGMDEDLKKLYNMAIVFVVFDGIVAICAFLLVRQNICTSGETSVLLAGMSTVISSGSFMLVVINTARQIKSENKPSKTPIKQSTKKERSR